MFLPTPGLAAGAARQIGIGNGIPMPAGGADAPGDGRAVSVHAANCPHPRNEERSRHTGLLWQVEHHRHGLTAVASTAGAGTSKLSPRL